MRSVQLVVVLLLLALTAPAAATTRAEAEAAIAAYEQAKRQHAAGELEAAYLLFWEADALYPGALPKYWQARCLDDLGQSDDAVAAYRAFLDATPADKHAHLARRAERRIAVLSTEPSDDGSDVAASATQKRAEKRAPKRAAKRAAKRGNDGRSAKRPERPKGSPPQPGTRDDGGDDRVGMKVAGFVFLAATLGSGAALIASFEQAHNARSPSHRDQYATATQVLVPVTVAAALTTAIVLPLSFAETDEGSDEPKAALTLGPSGAAVAVSF